MCLIVDEKKHIKIFNRYLFKIAKEDITVYKDLRAFGHDLFETPVMNEPVSFGENGIAVMSVSRFGWEYDKFFRKYAVGKGIHSYTSPKIPFYCRFYAIIPKGTRYFVGDCYDMVSTKLIIFRSYDDYEAFCRRRSIEKYKQSNK